jgi:site-specific recombinase XerD
VLKGADGRSGVSQDKLSRRFRKFCDMAKLSGDYDNYSLRHTFATEFMRRGGNIYYLQKEMGHKRIETTMKYIHTTASERSQHTLELYR